VGQSSLPGRLQALVELLGDERERIRAAAEDALRHEVLAPRTLRELVESIEDPQTRARARQGVAEIEARSLERELSELVEKGADLETGAFILARFQYPDLDVSAYRATLDEMAAELRTRLPSPSPAVAACGTLRRFIHEERGFKGNVETYADPENVFLNRVLDRRTGIPTSLACIYLLVARRLGLALEAINLPLHFLVRFSDAHGETFVDAFAKGRFLTRADCREFLREAGLDERPEYLVPASDRAVLARLTRGLVASYRSSGAERAAERFERCLAIVDEDD
jgi:regulator of sirC expression with transglutaminase-like and TPR domain